jgi:periplasmic protein TonB
VRGVAHTLPWTVRVGGGTAAALAGPAVLMAVLLWLNEPVQAPKASRAPVTATFDARPRPPKPPPAKSLAPPRASARSTAPVAAPPPEMGQAVGGIDVGLAGYTPGLTTAAADRLLGQANVAVMTESAVDVPPKPRERAPLAYPPEARSKGVTGKVVVNLLIDQSGRVQQAVIVESTPPGVFDAVVQAAALDWQFEPAVYGGTPVRVWARQSVRFNLD